MAYTYDYPRPGVATDIVVFTLRDRRLEVLLVERGVQPFAGCWALPGGFLQPNEDLESCARRELHEETGLSAPVLRQFATFSAPARDPRWVVSVGYFALLPSQVLNPTAGTDAANVGWFQASRTPQMAFDHDKILQAAVTALQQSAREIAVLLALVPEQFTLTELQVAHDAILGLPAHGREKRKAHFRKVAKASGLIQETQGYVRGSHRPAQLYVAAPTPSSHD